MMVQAVDNSLVVGVGTDNQEDCPLVCRNNGTCVEGPPDFSNHTDDAGEVLPFLGEVGFSSHHCECLEGYIGLLCQHNFEECIPGINGDSQTPVGPGGEVYHRCYHGGLCVPIVNSVESTHFVCDCADAHDENQTQYVGKYCQHALSTPCDDGDDDPTTAEGRQEHYCIHDGICRVSPLNGKPYCDCPPEFTGRFCEFRTAELPPNNNNTTATNDNDNPNNDDNNNNSTTTIECQLNCWNGGECHLGFDLHNDTSRTFQVAGTHTFQHCECAPGYAGILCEQKLCPDRDCQHGSVCVQSESSTLNGHPVALCDCNQATRHFPDGSVYYAGRECEYASTTICGANDTTSTSNQRISSAFFCVNGGVCTQDPTVPGVYACDCSASPSSVGFHGLHCELPNDVDGDGDLDLDPLPCSLDCANGGVCAKGLQDYGILNQFSPGAQHIIDQSSNENLEHCKCPEGFTGLLCERRAELCGDDARHVCFHGAECIQDSQNNWSCNCLPSTAGEYCQHQDPVICPDGRGFCVNGGTCTNNANQPTCTCPIEFTGVHCERIVPDIQPGDDVSSPTDPTMITTPMPITPQPTMEPTPQPTTTTTTAPPPPTPLPTLRAPKYSPVPTPILKQTLEPTPELKFDFNPATLIWDDDFVEMGFDDDTVQPRGSNNGNRGGRLSRGHSRAIIGVSTALILLSASVMGFSVWIYLKSVRREREMMSLTAADTLHQPTLPRSKKARERNAQLGERVGQELII